MNNEMLSAEALLLARGYLYELFHKVLGGYPTPELVAMLSSEETLDALDEYAASGDKLAELRNYLGSLAKKVAEPEELEAFVDSARDEYTRLFVGPGALPAQPMETPYVLHESILFSETTVAVRRAYKAHGFAPVRELHVADDHVSLMCDFMARLSCETLTEFRSGDLEAFRASVADQIAFAAAHMASWLPRFAELQSEQSNSVLYPMVTAGLAEFVNLDILFLSEITTWVDAEDSLDPQPERPESFERFDKAFKSLQALRLFGLEDCELRVL